MFCCASSGKCSNLGQFPAQPWKNKKNQLEKNYCIFFKKSHSKHISYTFLKISMNSMDQPSADIIKNVLYSYSLYFLHLENFLLYSSSRRFLYRSRPYWRLFSFSSSKRFLYLSQAYWRFLLFSSSEGFWYLSRASFWSFSLFFRY